MLASYAEELERAKMPGYVSRYDDYETDDFDVPYDIHAAGRPARGHGRRAPATPRARFGATPSTPGAASPSSVGRTSLLARRAAPEGVASEHHHHRNDASFGNGI